MAPERLSALQRRILAWLQAEEQRTRGTMSASYSELVQALGHEKGNLSHSLANLEAKGLVRRKDAPLVEPRGWKAVQSWGVSQGTEAAALASTKC
jgi:DNA-binding MarR family transcriptional regulator